MNRSIIDLCDQIDAAYAADRSLDDGVLQMLIEMGDQTEGIRALAQALREIEALDDSVVGLNRIEYARTTARAALAKAGVAA